MTEIKTPVLTKPKTFATARLVVNAAMGSYRDAAFNLAADGTISGIVQVHITDENGQPPARYPESKHIQLFEITNGQGQNFVPVGPLSVGNPLPLEFIHGALTGRILNVFFKHKPDISQPKAGQLRQIQFLLIVSPAGIDEPFLAGYAGMTLISAVVFV